MPVFREDGTRVAKSAFPTSAPPRVPLRVTERLFLTEDFEGRTSRLIEGDKRTLLVDKDAIVFQSDIDALYPPATIAGVSPTSVPAAGGTVVTIKGTNLDGVTSVTFGGTAGTALTIVSRTELRVTTPAKTAGTHAISVVDDSGTVAAGNFTYA